MIIKNQKKKFKVTAKDQKKRLDVVLSTRFKQYSRQTLALVIKDGLVKVDDHIETMPSKVIRENQIIQVNLPSQIQDLKAEPIDLDIIHQDKDLIVVNKSAGIVMHPAGQHKQNTLANALKHKFGTFYLVHRLDKDTSGVVLVARNEKTKKFLSRLFEQRKIKKTYIALLQGKLTPKKAFIDMPIKRGVTGKFEVQAKGRSARSYWQVKEYIKNFSLVEIQPKTGRTHQIRVHFKAIGHPVVGDKLYGVEDPNLSRQFLHASQVEFVDQLGHARQFSAPLPKDLNNFL